MDASVSRAVGGFKSIFLKPFDPLFRKDGAGAVVPIKIARHTRSAEDGVQMGKVFGRAKLEFLWYRGKERLNGG